MRDKPLKGQIAIFPDGASRGHLLETRYRDAESRILRFLRARLGSEAEAQDAAQQTFLRLWGRRDELRDDKIVALMFVTARNIATDMLRGRARTAGNTSKGNSDALLSVPDEGADPHRALAARHDLALALRLIDELPTRCRTAFIRRQVDGAAYADIARELGVTESMVRKYVLRATVHCSERYAELDGWE